MKLLVGAWPEVPRMVGRDEGQKLVAAARRGQQLVSELELEWAGWICLVKVCERHDGLPPGRESGRPRQSCRGHRH